MKEIEGRRRKTTGSLDGGQKKKKKSKNSIDLFETGMLLHHPKMASRISIFFETHNVLSTMTSNFFRFF